MSTRLTIHVYSSGPWNYEEVFPSEFKSKNTKPFTLVAACDWSRERTLFLKSAYDKLHPHTNCSLAEDEDGLSSDWGGGFIAVIGKYFFRFEYGSYSDTFFDRWRFPSQLDISTVRAQYGEAPFDLVLGRDLLTRYQEALMTQKSTESILCTPVFPKPTWPPDASLCFVIMPFTESWSNRVWTRHIRPAITRAGFRAERADDLFTTNVLISDIWNAIYASAVVLADVTDNNPNVFYELGIAHTLGKKVIIICQEHSRRPFDTSHWRQIHYQDNSEECERLESAVVRTLQQLRQELHIG